MRRTLVEACVKLIHLLVVVFLTMAMSACTIKGGINSLKSLSPLNKIKLQLDSFTVSEGSSPVMVIVLSKEPETASRLRWTISEVSEDPTFDFLTLTGTVTVQAGDLTKTVSIPIFDDAIFEGDEEFKLTLTEEGDQGIFDESSTTFTVTDNEPIPVITFAAADQTVSESVGSTSIQVGVTPASSKPITVAYTVSGTATSADHSATSGTITIPAKSTTQTITTTITDDLLGEATETATFTLTSVSSGTGSIGNQATHDLNITDNENFSETLSISDETINESAGTATFTVTLSAPVGVDVGFDWTTTNGTAAAGSDYTASSGTSVLIATGNTTATITVPITQDVLDEDNETFNVVISNGANASISDSTGIGTITDDDATPTVTFSTASQSVSEGVGTAIVTVDLSSVSGRAITVPYTVTGTSTNPADHNVASSTIGIPAGSTSGTVTITIVDDTIDEPNETIILTMGVPSNATQGATTAQTVTITDNDATPTLSIADLTVNESAGTASFTVSLSAASGQAVTFDWATSNGTATAGSDYSASSATGVTIAAGSTTASLSVPITQDTLDEIDEAFTVTISNPTNATIADATADGTITDDDATPTISFSAASQSVAESVGGVTVTANISAASGRTVSVPFTVTGTAANPADHDLASGTITVTAGSTSGTATFNVVSDVLDEADETVILTMGTPTNATAGATTVHTVTITDDDATPSLSIDDVTVSESGGTATFTVTLSAASGRAVGFDWTTAAGTATAASDYTTSSGTTKTIAAGSTATTLTVPILSDTADEDDETYSVVISNPSNATISDNTGVGTITDDDAVPSLAVDDITVNEGDGTISVTVNLSAASGKAISFDWATSNGTATAGSDYTASSSNGKIITAGSTSTTLSIPITQDTLDEVDETITVTVSNPSNATISDSTAIVTITDDDAAPTITFSAAAQTVAEAAGTATVNVSISAVSSKAISVAYTITGTASNPSDHDLVGGTFNIAAGSTTASVTFNLAADNITQENDETVILTMGAPTNATGGANTVHTVTIDDDDDVFVTPVYTGNGNWMDYVMNDGADVYSATNTACTEVQTTSYYNACIHGGEKLKVQASFYTDCTNKTITDALGLFDWKCVNGTPVTFYMKGLKDGKGLRDLVDAAAFKDNYVTLKDNGVTTMISMSKAWWTNPVTPLPDNSAVGAGATYSSTSNGTIVTVATTQQTAGVKFIGDKIGLVVFDGAKLKWNGSMTNFCTISSNRCVFSINGSSFGWYEGEVDGAGVANYAVANSTTGNSYFQHFDHFSAVNSVDSAADFSRMYASRITNSNFVRNDNAAGEGGMWQRNSGYNVYQNIKVSASGYGFFFYSSTASYNIVTNLLTSASSQNIRITTNAQHNIFVNTTSTNGSAGVFLTIGADSNNFVNSAFVNNTSSVQFYDSGTNPPNGEYFHNTYMSTGNRGIYYNGPSDNNKFSGFLAYGGFSVTDCQAPGGTSGLTAACAPSGTSTHTQVSGRDASNGTFVGPGSSTTWALTLDFWNYANWFRTWGADGDIPLSSNDIGAVTSAAATKLWDWRLMSTDTQLLNRSGTASATNDVFTNGAACPSAVSGNATFTSTNGRVFLTAAIEIVTDDIGNNDGLCESNERCIYSPNIGAYQGEGDYSTRTCTFSDGTITGVTMYAYPTNGVP